MKTPEPVYTDSREFDPLELTQDRDIIPEKYPKTGAISGSKLIVESSSGKIDTASRSVVAIPDASDTLNNQVFRVQLLTTKYYNEAQKARDVAEEIFDRPVYLAYEVPYFKIRVGNFNSRDEAESYQQKTREAGYTNAWVVVVNVNVKEPAPLYENLPGLIIENDTTIKEEDTLSTRDEQEADE